MHYKKRQKYGFSLTEILVYMAVFSVIIAFMTTIFASMIDQQQEAQSASSLQQDGEYIMARLLYDVSRADSILSPVSAGQQTSSLQLSIGPAIFTYSLSGTDLVLNDGVSDYKLNSYGSNISDLEFVRVENDSLSDQVKISYRVTSTTIRDSGPQSRLFVTTAGLR